MPPSSLNPPRTARWPRVIGLTLLSGSVCIGAELASFQAGVGGWHLGTLAVGNLDSDGALELVVPYRDNSGRWFLDAFKLDGSRLPGFPYGGSGEEINVSPTLVDLDGDGRPEILFTHGTRVVALRANGTVMWSNVVNRATYVPDSGYMTSVGGFYWSDGGAFLSRLPATAVFSSQVSSPIVADVTGTGVKEVITAWKIDPDSTSAAQDFEPSVNDIWGFGEWGTVGETWSGGVVFMKATTGERQYIYHIHQLVESGLALGQADLDRALEVYVLNDSDSVVCFDRTQPHGFLGNGTLHKQFGKNQRLMSGSYQVGVDVYTADVDGDGRAEALVPTTHRDTLWQPSETILDDDGAILWRHWAQPVHFTLNQWQNNACMIPLNPDHDNHVDVLTWAHTFEVQYRYWNGAELINHPGWPKNFSPYLPTPPVVGDVDGDGEEEIVIGTFHPERTPSDGSLYVFGLNGETKHVVAVPGGLKHIPALADVNNDGGVDVVYRSLAGRVYVQNFGATKPTAVSWPCHRGNVERDGRFALSLFPPGTPLVGQKQGGYRRADFSWTVSSESTPRGWRIYRAERGDGPFAWVVSLAPSFHSFADEGLMQNHQYFYEVAAVYETNIVRSAPFVVTCSWPGNLIANGGFEENDNSHWDKWFTGDIDWADMSATSESVHGGRQAMEITWVNKGNNGTISQYGQYGTPDAYLSVTNSVLYSFGGFIRSSGITQPSEHWLEWVSTPTGEAPSPRPNPPWPYYFTPHLYLGTAATDWFFVNRTFVMPPGYPNLEVGHRFSVAAASDGRLQLDDLFFRPLPAPTASNWVELISFGSGWRYWANVPPADWFGVNFSDASWPFGLAKLGAGSGPTNIATLLPARKPEYYFRKTFVAIGFPYRDLLLSGTCTEGGTNALEMYFNGRRLPTSAIDAVSAQGNRVEYYDLSPFADWLHAGTNTLAVVLHNVSQPSYDDVAFALRLQATLYRPQRSEISGLTPEFDSRGRLQAVVISLHLLAGTIWRLESNDSLTDSGWQLMQRIADDEPREQQLRDITPAGRPGVNRFYRLVPD